MKAPYSPRILAMFLRVVGVFTQLAFAAAVMPANWINKITDEMQLEPFPDTPLAFYLARHLSLLYGFVGIGLIVISYDLPKYRDLVSLLGFGTIGFGVLQAWIDHQSGMPIWWSAGESISTIIGGLMILWLDDRCGRESIPNEVEGS